MLYIICTFSGPLGNDWKKVNAKFSASQKFRLLFRMVIGGKMFSDGAIDDVSVGRCLVTTTAGKVVT